eukprot:2302477-Amphidinium_carterae.1
MILSCQLSYGVTLCAKAARMDNNQGSQRVDTGLEFPLGFIEHLLPNLATGTHGRGVPPKRAQ